MERTLTWTPHGAQETPWNLGNPERLGHSGVGITLNTYSHILPGMQEDVALRLDRALSEARTPKSRLTR